MARLAALNSRQSLMVGESGQSCKFRHCSKAEPGQIPERTLDRPTPHMKCDVAAVSPGTRRTRVQGILTAKRSTNVRVASIATVTATHENPMHANLPGDEEQKL